jgi:hypothetical protein
MRPHLLSALSQPRDVLQTVDGSLGSHSRSTEHSIEETAPATAKRSAPRDTLTYLASSSGLPSLFNGDTALPFDASDSIPALN